MNRALMLGLAMFAVVVAIAIVGGGSSVVMAGHGCHGCDGASCCAPADCCAPACSGACDCGGRRGLFARLRARGCCGCDAPPACCCPAPSCGAPAGGGDMGVPPTPEKPQPSASLNRNFRAVSFAR